MKGTLIFKRVPTIVAIILLIVVIFSFNIFVRPLILELIWEKKDIQQVDTNWGYHWGEIEGDFVTSQDWQRFSFPGKPPNQEGNNIIYIQGTIPATEIDSPFLYFETSQQSLEVYMNNEMVYSYGNTAPENDKRGIGVVDHFIPLEAIDNNSKIMMKIHSPYIQSAGYLGQLYVGTYKDIFKYFVITRSGNFIEGFIYICLGLFLILFHFLIKKPTALLSIAIACIGYGLWYCCESRVLQLFTNKSLLIMYIACLGIFMLPPGLLSFIKTEFNIKHKGIINVLCNLFIAYIPIAFILDFTGAVPLYSFMRVFFVLLVASALAVAYLVGCLVITKRRCDETIFFISMILLGITGIWDVVSIFYAKNANQMIISNNAVLLVIFSLLYITSNNYIKMNDELERYSNENETNYKSLFENMLDGFCYCEIIRDEKGCADNLRILETNTKFEELIGKKRSSIVGRKISCIFPEIKTRMGLKWLHAIRKVDNTSKRIKSSGHSKTLERWFDVTFFSPRQDHVCMIVTEISYLKRIQNELRESKKKYKIQAYTDKITKLKNRAYFELKIEKYNKDIEDNMPLTIMICDIDGLKIVNDTLGHKSGDDLLISFSDILTKVFNTGVLARTGGDEFSLILPDCNIEKVREMKETLNDYIELHNRSNPMAILSVSVGMAQFDKQIDHSIYETCKRADDDMYKHKLSKTSSEKSKVIDMLLAALSQRDYVAEGHVNRMTELCERISEILELDESQSRELVLLAKVHDLGKIGIPDGILFKQGKLTEAEYEKIKEHSLLGYKIANRSRELSHIAELILHHHERWDGNGYPNGLKEYNIPLECRILAIIDSYDAMTSNRPYNKAKSKSEAIEELNRCAGKQFDPILTGIFVDLILNYENELLGNTTS